MNPGPAVVRSNFLSENGVPQHLALAGGSRWLCLQSGERLWKRPVHLENQKTQRHYYGSGLTARLPWDVPGGPPDALAEPRELLVLQDR